MEGKMNVFLKVVTRFVVGGGFGVACGILSFNVLSSTGMSAQVANALGYALGAVVNLAFQWRMRDYHAR